MTPEDFQKAQKILADDTAPLPVRQAAMRVLQRSDVPFGPPEAPPEAEPAAARALSRIAKEEPDLLRAVKYGKTSVVPKLIPGMDSIDIAEAEKKAAEEESAKYARPPEFHPEAPPATGILGALKSARDALPERVGGATQHFTEPSVDQFRADMARLGNPALAAADDTHPAFAAYADKLWADAYDQAKAQGRHIVRDDKVDHTLSQRAMQALDAGVQMGDAGVAGAVDALSLGGMFLPKQMNQELDEKMSRSRVGSLVGELGGGALLGGGIGSLVKGVAPGLAEAAGSTFLRRAATGAATGAGLAAAQTAGHEMGRGEPVDGLGSAALMGGVLGGGAEAVASGLDLAVGKGLRKAEPAIPIAEQGGAKLSFAHGIEPGPEQQALRDEAVAQGFAKNGTPDVQAMLSARLAPELERTAKIARGRETEAFGGQKAAYQGATEELRIPLHETINTLESEHRALINKASGLPVAARAGTEAKSLAAELPLLTKISAVLPEDYAPPENALPPHAAMVLGDAARPETAAPEGARHLSFKEATLRGYDAKGAVQELVTGLADKAGMTPKELLEKSPGLLDDIQIRVEPRPFNAQEHDEMSSRMAPTNIPIQDQRGADRALSVAVKKDRDRFTAAAAGIGPDTRYSFENATGKDVPLSGYSAFMKQEGDQLRAFEEAMQAAQVGTKGLRGQLANYGASGNADAENVIHRLAQESGPGAMKEADLLRYANAIAHVEKATKLREMIRFNTGGLTERGMATGLSARARLNPILEPTIPAFRGAAGAAAPIVSRATRPEAPLPGGASQQSIDEISRLLQIGGP